MITLVDYGDECVTEVASSLKKITDDFLVSGNEADICRSNKIIFAGSGSASAAMKKIHLLNLFSVLRIVKKPMLGIGLGIQLMADYSNEGNFSCLGFFPGTSIKFEANNDESSFKGFNKISFRYKSPLFEGIEDQSKFYFNNSYYLPQNDITTSICTNDFNKVSFCSSMENEKSYGVQFHPEMSGEVGLKLLKNFIEM